MKGKGKWQLVGMFPMFFDQLDYLHEFNIFYLILNLLGKYMGILKRLPVYDVNNHFHFLKVFTFKIKKIPAFTSGEVEL